jgi:predicted DNA-binding transcriptional regulator AlpA
MQTPNERLVRVHEVMDRCGLAQSTLYEQIKYGRFPKPVKIRLGGKSRSAARWRESDVRAWIAKQIKASHSAGPIAMTLEEEEEDESINPFDKS